MDETIKKIMELVQRGVLTPEDAEKMIKEIKNQGNFVDSAVKTAKDIGNKVGEEIDNLSPKVKKGLRDSFVALGYFGHKMATKFEEKQFGYEDDIFDDEFDVEYEEAVVVEEYEETTETTESAENDSTKEI